MIFPNQQRQQVVLSKIQDGGRGNDLPDKEMTAAQDFSQEEPNETILS